MSSTTTKKSDKATVCDVAKKFVGVYYQVMSQKPEELPSLYDENSELHHFQIKVQGRKTISQVCLQLPLSKKALPPLTSITAQETTSDGVLIVVVGTLSNGDMFSQTFVLERNNSTKDLDSFVCRNDIFQPISIKRVKDGKRKKQQLNVKHSNVNRDTPTHNPTVTHNSDNPHSNHLRTNGSKAHSAASSSAKIVGKKQENLVRSSKHNASDTNGQRTKKPWGSAVSGPKSPSQPTPQRASNTQLTTAGKPLSSPSSNAQQPRQPVSSLKISQNQPSSHNTKNGKATTTSASKKVNTKNKNKNRRPCVVLNLNSIKHCATQLFHENGYYNRHLLVQALRKEFSEYGHPVHYVKVVDRNDIAYIEYATVEACKTALQVWEKPRAEGLFAGNQLELQGKFNAVYQPKTPPSLKRNGATGTSTR